MVGMIETLLTNLHKYFSKFSKRYLKLQKLLNRLSIGTKKFLKM